MATPGASVGSGALITPGGAQGPQGATGPSGGSAVSANANNKATLGTDNYILVQGVAAGTTATTHAQTVSGDDPQLTNARTPTAHAPTHAKGGSDFVADVPSTDAGNLLTSGSDSLLYLPASAIQPTIWSARLRSINSFGNPTYEVDQRAVGAVVNPPNATNNSFLIDRWTASCSAATGRISAQQMTAATVLPAPGTNFAITSKYLRITCTTAQASIGTAEYIQIGQALEGPQVRELFYDATSLSFLVRSSVAPFTFGVVIRDSAPTKSFVHLFTIPTANVSTLCTLPNIPVFPSGNFSMSSGVAGTTVNIVLACGSTLFTTPDTWQSGNYLTASGIGNFLATSGATFDFIFSQWEPGQLCTQLIDKPFAGANGNYEECLRYYCKSYDYDVAVGTANASGEINFGQNSTQFIFGVARFPKPMAAIPGVVAYSFATGAANSLRLTNGTDYAVSSVTATKNGISVVTASSAMPAVAAGVFGRFHYVAGAGY